MEIKSIRKSAFDAVYDANAEKVYRIALYYSGDHHAAEDITQTVFMKLYTNMENINVDRIEAWVKTTAKHMALNYSRHLQYEFDLPVEDMEYIIDSNVYMDSVEDVFVDYSCETRRTKLAENIYEALYCKNVRWYEAVTITYILEKPQKEVAETMGMSLGALQLTLHRAKKWIRKSYQEQLDHLDET